MNYFKCFFIFSLVILLISCSKEEHLLLKVASKREWRGEYHCYIVQENGNNKWTYFYDNIDGFMHVEGHEYVIEVTVYKKKHVAMDESSMRYELDRIVSDSIKESDLKSLSTS